MHTKDNNMVFGSNEGGGGKQMAGSTVVSNPIRIGCRLRGNSTNNTTPLSSKKTGRAAVLNTGSETGTSDSKISLSGQVSNAIRPTKPCCFCWCCCCSCSCNKFFGSLAIKNLEENGATKTSNNSESIVCDGEALPSLEDIRNWGNSFDKLMKSAGGRKIFRDFLRCEYSEENILFWLACEDLKQETNPDVIEEKARKIYEDFISILSPKEVSLDSRVREIVNRNMIEPTPHTFDEAQLQIYTLMHRDSYPRFVNSSLFKNLAQMNNCSSSSGAGAENAGSSSTQPNPASTSVTSVTVDTSSTIQIQPKQSGDSNG